MRTSRNKDESNTGNFNDKRGVRRDIDATDRGNVYIQREKKKEPKNDCIQSMQRLEIQFANGIYRHTKPDHVLAASLNRQKALKQSKGKEEATKRIPERRATSIFTHTLTYDAHSVCIKQNR